jgi:uncharacterized protein YlxW (UPF0749 family)
VIRDLSSRLEARTAEAVEMRTRLELTAEAESTLRERVEKLEAKLEAERSAYQQLPKSGCLDRRLFSRCAIKSTVDGQLVHGFDGTTVVATS